MTRNLLFLLLLFTAQQSLTMENSQSSAASTIPYGNSQLSAASTIPYELTLHHDQDFVDELEDVNELYFGHIDISNASINSASNSDCDSDSNSEIDDNDDAIVSRDYSDIHSQILPNDTESVKQNDFFINTCGCKKLYNGKSCSSVVNRDIVLQYRMSMQEKTKPELDLIIKSQLFHHRNNDEKNLKGNARKKPRQHYFFAGKSVCRDLFAFAHDVHRRTIDVIARSLDSHGVDYRVHGNKGVTPKHALNLEETQYIKNFLVTYATQYGVPLPGRVANYRDFKGILLPSDKNKTDIFSDFCAAAESAGMRKVTLRTFHRLWSSHCPNILVMKPSTDLCTKCQKHTHTIMNSGNCTEEEKQETLAVYSDHLHKVQTQREHYRQQCEEAKTVFTSLPPENKARGQIPGSQDITATYSFDYAQQIFYPHYAQQVGPLFFKTPRKCQCFGVCCESSGSHIFYLIDEGEGIGKGANSVVSMVHHQIHHLGYGERRVRFNMDNCSGQNKNNTVIGYGLWTTLKGIHEMVEFSLMEAGHTKFSPDWHFGLWKLRWRHSTVESIEDIADSVRKSSRGGYNIPQLISGIDGQNPVIFHDWASFLCQIFKKVPNITKYHYFRMTSEEKGTVFMREYMYSEEVSFQAMKPGAVITDFPTRLEAKGLDACRQWYLYEQIAPFCLNGTVACPKPTIVKQSKKCD